MADMVTGHVEVYQIVEKPGYPPAPERLARFQVHGDGIDDVKSRAREQAMSKREGYCTVRIGEAVTSRLGRAHKVYVYIRAM